MSTPNGFDITRMRARLGVIGPEMTEKGEKAVAIAAEYVLGVAIPLTPVDEGTLRNSGKVTRRGLTAIVSFDTPYARRQHEDMSLKHPGGGGPKYLEKAFNESHDKILDIYKREMRM